MSGYLGRDYLQEPTVRSGTSSPDGVVSAPKGTLFVNTTTGSVWQNIDGSTAWRPFGTQQIPWSTNAYVFLPNATNTSTSSTMGVGTMRLVPFSVPNSSTLDRLGAEVTVVGDAGSKIRLGIYNTGSDGRPNALVSDAGTIAGDSATVQEITGLSIPLQPGYYWACSVVQVVSSTQPTIRTAASGSGGVMPVRYLAMPTAGQVAAGYLASGITGALPATVTVTDIHNSFARIFARVA